MNLSILLEHVSPPSGHENGGAYVLWHLVGVGGAMSAGTSAAAAGVLAILSW